MNHNHKAYFAIEKRLRNMGIDVDRAELIHEMTDGQSQSLKELDRDAYATLIRRLNSHFAFDQDKSWQQNPKNRMRRKVWTLLVCKMGYTEEQMEGWVEKYSKYKKPLREHSEAELKVLVTQAEAVYQSFIKGVR